MSSLPPITRGVDAAGHTVYSFWADQSWEAFDTLLKYLKKYWGAKIVKQRDDIYSRVAELEVEGMPVRLTFDSQEGVMFGRADGGSDCAVLDRIYADLKQRLS